MQEAWKRIFRSDGPNVAAKGRSSRVRAESFDLGRLVTPTTFSRLGGCCGEASIFLDFAVRAIQISFCEGCCIAFQTRELEDFVLLDCSSLYLTLRHPPRLYVTNGAEELEYATRATGFEVAGASGLNRHHFGTCRTICVTFRRSDPGIGEDTVVKTVLDFLTAVEKLIYAVSVKPISVTTVCLDQSRHSNDRDVDEAWRVLSSATGFVEERFTSVFFEKLDECSEKLAARVLYTLARLSSRDLFLDPVKAFDDALKSGCSIDDVHDTRLHCRVPRLVITPTRHIFYEAEVIQSNRVLREWGPTAQFLRVSIRDDDLKKLSTTKGGLSVVLKTIFHQLKTGLTLGSRIFQFLGCSNNQVRDHGCFFVDATQQEQIVQDIRCWAGNLDEIHNVAKYVSRLGQVFSTSTNTVKVDVRECQKIQDITENGYCFTDGIGRISADLAEEVVLTRWSEGSTEAGVALKLGEKRAIPCAFQIRFGGCKGVVAVDMHLQEEYPGRRLCYRDSMLKYWSSHMNIEVLSSCARPQELYLNQQLILLLNHLGVPDRIFLKLLHESLNSLSRMFIDEEVARRKLQSVDCGIDWDLVKQTNFYTTTDPYLRSMLMALYRLLMKGLREKSRIPVSASDARILIGTVDESRSLEYGQVFIQISKHLQNPGVEKTILQKRVVIGKSPCLHPGDVRTFDAVDCPALHHMCDCVVFPSKGPRPHPNELSGSDLDGDLYHVIWGDELMPTKPNVTPMDYSATTSHTYHEKITSHHMLDFLRENIENDCLGQIDNTHKALADQKGVDSQHCLQLAKLHSQAVDAPKTGQWTSVPRQIRQALDKYPDFMMKQDRPSYPSEKILGVIYRECTKFLNTCSIHKTSLHTVDEALSQTVNGMKGMEQFLGDARRLRRQYNGKLHALMAMYGISTEAEFMTGFVEQLHEKIGKETFDVTSLIRHLKDKLIQKYRDLFFQVTPQQRCPWCIECLQDERIQENGVVDEKALCKAAAWYHVCYSPAETCETYTVGKTSQRFLSFAWIPSEYLLRLFEQDSTSERVDGAKERIGQSVYDMLSSASRRLLHTFQEQLQIKEHVQAALSKSNDVLVPYLYGLSYTLLFDERSPQTELILWFPGLEAHLFQSIPIDTATQRDRVHAVKCTLHNCGIDVRVVICGKRTLLFFNCYVASLGRHVRGHVALDPLCWLQSALLLEYIYHYPWLLPLLRVVIKWACATEFVGSFQNALIDSLSVCFLLLDYLLRTGAIDHILDPKEVLENINSKFDDYASVEGWQEILDRLFSEPPAAAPMGELLLGFFSDQNSCISQPLHPSLEPVIGYRYCYQICSMQSVQLLQEEMQRAFHKLCFHCCIPPLFVQVQTEKVLHLPVQYAKRMEGSEQFFARLYSRQTRTSVEVHQRGDRAGGLLIKVTGASTGIHAVEKLLEQFKSSSEAMDRVNSQFPGVMEIFAENSQRYIVEGIGSDVSVKKILLEDFCGARHPVDDNTGLYALRVYAPSESIPRAMYDMTSKKFIHFRSFLLERLRLLQRSDQYSLFLHGPLTFQILFGKFYLSSPTKEMMEDPEGMTFEQLVCLLHRSSRKVIRETLRWREEIEQSAVIPDATSQRQRTAFFSKVHQGISKAALEQLLSRYGLEETGLEQRYVLSLRGQCHGVVARYRSDLSLSSVSYPPIRWMVVDIKRFFKELTEMDIRYDLTSYAPCKAPRVLSMVQQALHKRHPRPNAMPAVFHQLMPVANSLKHIVKRTFKYQEQHRTPFWQAVQVELSDVTLQSRPKIAVKPEFSMTERFFDLRLKMDLSIFHDQLPSDAFISEMWYQALYLSDELSQMAHRRRA